MISPKGRFQAKKVLATSPLLRKDIIAIRQRTDSQGRTAVSIKIKKKKAVSEVRPPVMIHDRMTGNASHSADRKVNSGTIKEEAVQNLLTVHEIQDGKQDRIGKEIMILKLQRRLAELTPAINILMKEKENLMAGRTKNSAMTEGVPQSLSQTGNVSVKTGLKERQEMMHGNQECANRVMHVPTENRSHS